MQRWEPRTLVIKQDVRAKLEGPNKQHIAFVDVFRLTKIRYAADVTVRVVDGAIARMKLNA